MSVRGWWREHPVPDSEKMELRDYRRLGAKERDAGQDYPESDSEASVVCVRARPRATNRCSSAPRISPKHRSPSSPSCCNTTCARYAPGYQFRLEQGLKTIRRGAAAGSGFASGATFKALSTYGQDMASQEYQSAYDRALQRHLMQRQNVLDERGADIQDFEIARRDALIGRDWELQDFNLERGHAESRRDQELLDYKLNRQNAVTERQWELQDYSVNQAAKAE